jgi:hypothetical protein
LSNCSTKFKSKTKLTNRFLMTTDNQPLRTIIQWHKKYLQRIPPVRGEPLKSHLLHSHSWAAPLPLFIVERHGTSEAHARIMPTDARVFAAGAWILPTLAAWASEGHNAADRGRPRTRTAAGCASRRRADADRGRPDPRRQTGAPAYQGDALSRLDEGGRHPPTPTLKFFLFVLCVICNYTNLNNHEFYICVTIFYICVTIFFWYYPSMILHDTSKWYLKF